MAEALEVVVAGYVGVDLAPEFAAGPAAPLAELLRPGKLIEVGPLEITSGGVVANTGLALARFGARVALMGMVGQDALGELLSGLLEGQGAHLCLRRTAAAGTAYGFVLAPPGTDRIFLECPGCNATYSAADVDYDLVAGSRLFHFGYPPLMARMFAEGGAELESMFRRVKGLGVMTSLDMTLPDPQGPAGAVDWRALLARVLPHVDVFTPSLEELLYMLAPAEWAARVAAAGDGDLAEVLPTGRDEELADEALALGARIVFLKAGDRGCCLHTGDVAGLPLDAAAWTDCRLRVGALPLDADRFRNACGAGDAAVAGLLLAVLRGAEPATAARLAMRAGRDSLYGVDTTSGLVSWAEMQPGDSGE